MATAHSDIPNSMLVQVVAGRTPPLEPLSITQVEQMMAHGILLEGSPIELIDGLLIRKDRSTRGGDPMTHHPRHAVCVSRLQGLARRVELHGCHLRSQLPIALTEFRAPEPDLAIIRGKPEEYRDRHPGPNDTVAVIEVADSSLDFDQTTKYRLYAAAGIAVYWIANVVDNVIEVYEQPDALVGEYRVRRDYQSGQTIDLPLPSGVSLAIDVASILG
ncbi:MAG: Uma2 family endonuclease [Pirellulaceae bacterium]